MQSSNIPQVKLGIIAVSRDCFPIALSTQRRENIVKAYQGEIFNCPTTVENEQDMLKAVAEVKEAADRFHARYRAVGKAMGVKGIDEMNDVEAADATIAAVKQLSADVGIPANLHGILKEEDIQFLAESAFADACRPGNPRDTSVEEIVELYKSQL